MDETTLSLHPPLHKCWMKRGQPKRIQAPGLQRWHHVFGAYNWRTDLVSWTTASHKNSESFIQFIDHLLTHCYPSQKVILVMDNATYHKSAAACAAISLFDDRLHVLWLPPFCPLLNPIERFWLHFKRLACANQLYTSLHDLIVHAESALVQQNVPTSPYRFVFQKSFD